MKSRKKVRSNSNEFTRQVLGELCEWLVKCVLVFIGYLEYVTSVRSSIISSLGLYWVGLTDGSIFVISLVVIIVFAYSRSLRGSSQ